MNYTYILRCADNTLYTGWTNNIEKRLNAHNSGQGAKYTKPRLPVELVYLEEYEKKEEAMSREAEIKKLTKKEKLKLIASYENRKNTNMPMNLMSEFSTIMEDIEDRLAIFKNMYSYIRIVDPVSKQAFMSDFGIIDIAADPNYCYKFWKKNTTCENCISMRAYHEKTSVVKMEIKDGKRYFIQAFPIELEDKTFIVEMLKDITEDGVVLADKKGGTVDLNDYINNLNSKIMHDQLTGLYNRRYLIERMPMELHRQEDREKVLAAVLLDIDYFKKVNDKYGHIAGDFVLEEVAAVLSNTISGHGWASRYGGEEFFLALNLEDEKEALLILETIRKKIEVHTFALPDFKIKITCSFGVTIVNSEMKSVEDIIRTADKALLEAKNRGRNCVVLKE